VLAHVVLGAKDAPKEKLIAQLALLKTGLTKLGAKDKPVVLYCASGTRSSMARSVLKGQGFTQVFNLGAMSRW
jgi:rhodanese-related sulfurtransferase